jgi:hypothetical protein
MWRRSIAIISGVVVSLSSARAQAPAKQPDEPEAIRKGLAYLEDKALNWLRQRKCASCHHLPMMVWAQRDARQRGFKIDEKGLQEATDFLLAADNRAGILPKPGDPERAGNSFSLLAAYTILAFRDGGKEPEAAAKEIMKKAAAHIIAKQENDGSWKRFEGRPPIFPLQEATTLLAAHVLEPVPKADTEATAKSAKIRQWLTANARGENQQDLCWRVLIGHERQASVEQLLKRQNPDGGWSQTKEMASDACATGQAIYALLSRGGIDQSAPAILKARDFLLKTQKSDGSWPMTARPPNSGAIADRWRAGPQNFYLIDHRGVIRHKWISTPNEDALNSSLEKLIQEAKGSGKNTSK